MNYLIRHFFQALQLHSWGFALIQFFRKPTRFVELLFTNDTSEFYYYQHAAAAHDKLHVHARNQKGINFF